MNDSNERPAAVDSLSASAPRARSAVRPQTPRADADDARLGPRPADVTHWRCRRVDDGSKGTPLFCGDDEGVQVSEWAIKTLSIDILRERWGAGRYVVHYIRVDADGSRMPRGRSRVFQLLGSPTDDAPAVVVGPAPARTSQLGSFGTDPSYVFSLLTFLEDRNDKARAAAAAEAKAQNDRYRADMELVMERERIASRERIAQMEAASRRNGVDPEAFMERLAQLVDAKVQEVAGNDDDAPAPVAPSLAMVPAQPDPFGRLIEMLTPVLPLLVQKLAPDGKGSAGA